MSQPLISRLCVAALSLACASAQAGYVLSSQGVSFEFNQLDADSFTFKITNADNATGNWASDTHLSFLGFKDLGPLTGISNATVTNMLPASASVWSYSTQELNGNGCLGGNSGGICLDANPDIALANIMMFQIDLLGTTLAIDPATGPHLKIGFTYWVPDKGDPTKRNFVPGHYEIGGDLLSQNMIYTSCTSSTDCNGGNGGGGGGGGAGGGGSGGTVPEPATLGLFALALLSASQARRLQPNRR
ncbi:PEP-CTERM sorting domain-containing protein [Roseateles sp. BYS96W]|uniref:PEP-CTERM sorting domain-containing protein n=1 Tax=Pelomonas nitida TaxID=3299027 RepID=A0ABW7GCB3_9BURK